MYKVSGKRLTRFPKSGSHAPPPLSDIQRESKKTEQSIKECAKRGDKRSMSVLALELLRTRKAVSRLHTSKAQMNSVSLHLNENLGAQASAARLARSGLRARSVSTQSCSSLNAEPVFGSRMQLTFRRAAHL